MQPATFQFLEFERQPSPAIESLLSVNVIGTPGQGMVYQHVTVKEKLYRIARPHIVFIRRNETLMGACVFCERTLEGATAFYVRYFTFSDAFRLRTIPCDRARKKSSVLREEVEQLLNGKGLTDDESKTFFYYAYVDPRNPRSARLCQEFGFTTVRKYSTRLFSRVWPKAHPHLMVQTLPVTDRKIQELLRSFYATYNHVSFDNLTGTYYYVEEAGEMVAGVHVQPDAWRILALPGAKGKLLLNLFDKLPLFSRLLSKHFRFLAVEGIYFKTGREYVFEQLLESLLHRYKLNTGIMVVDATSSLYQLTQRINLGLLAKISPLVYGDVIVRPVHADETFMTRQKSRPAYISVHDVS